MISSEKTTETKGFESGAVFFISHINFFFSTLPGPPLLRPVLLRHILLRGGPLGLGDGGLSAFTFHPPST